MNLFGRLCSSSQICKLRVPCTLESAQLDVTLSRRLTSFFHISNELSLYIGSEVPEHSAVSGSHHDEEGSSLVLKGKHHLQFAALLKERRVVKERQRSIQAIIDDMEDIQEYASLGTSAFS